MFTKFDPKDPDAVKNYTWDFSQWLATGETISSYSFPGFPAGITKDTDSNTAVAVTATISAGTAGEDYDITCRISTNAGQTEDLTATLPVRTT